MSFTATEKIIFCGTSDDETFCNKGLVRAMDVVMSPLKLGRSVNENLFSFVKLGEPRHEYIKKTQKIQY